MQGLFLLGSKTKKSTPVISFSWKKKQPALIADLITLCMCFHSLGMHVMNYCRTDSRSVTLEKKKSK